MQCIYCQQVRAKNTSRQRQHLLECPTYLNVMKDSIPANNLLHTFPEGDIARSLQIPVPSIELDFRMSIKLNPKVSIGSSLWGGRDWVSFLGGQWAGRWGKGIILVRTSSRVVLLKCVLTCKTARWTGFPSHSQRNGHIIKLQLCPPIIRRTTSIHHRQGPGLVNRCQGRSRETSRPRPRRYYQPYLLQVPPQPIHGKR